MVKASGGGQFRAIGLQKRAPPPELVARVGNGSYSPANGCRDLQYVRYRTIIQILALSWRRSHSCAHPVCLSAVSMIESDVCLTRLRKRRTAKLKRFSRISWPRFTRNWNA